VESEKLDGSRRELVLVCVKCRRVRRDGYWAEAELNTGLCNISHGICPECARMLYPEYFAAADFPAAD
jgi:hypothetical protein